MKFPNSGLYAITRTHTEFNSEQQLLTEVSAAIRGGATVIQYRDKNAIHAVQFARALIQLCHAQTIPLIINDNIELAKNVGADGVHLGKEDSDIMQARALLGNDSIIGVSCYNSIERALLAQTQGASYVAFGRFFPSNSKPLAAPAQRDTLIQAKTVLNIPIVAIGGILPDNGADLLTAGANLLAVIGGLFNHNNTEIAARAYQHLFTAI